eukprot:jgi/Ulvmu1/8425/UM043_0003.1
MSWLTCAEDHFQLTFDGDSLQFSLDRALRSNVLRQLQESREHGGAVHLPLHGRAVQLWLSFIELPDGASMEDLPVETAVSLMQAADVLGDTQAVRQLSGTLAACLFPSPNDDEKLLEVVMFESNDDVWESSGMPVEEGTVRGEMERRFGMSQHVRSGLFNSSGIDACKG